MILVYKIPIIITWDLDSEEYISDSVRLDCTERAVDSWNNDDVGQYLLNGYETTARIENGEMFVDVTINKLSLGIMNKIKDAIEGQCSDGWGEGFEQQEQIIDTISYYISTWSPTDHVEFIGIK